MVCEVDVELVDIFDAVKDQHLVHVPLIGQSYRLLASNSEVLYPETLIRDPREDFSNFSSKP